VPAWGRRYSSKTFIENSAISGIKDTVVAAKTPAMRSRIWYIKRIDGGDWLLEISYCDIASNENVRTLFPSSSVEYSSWPLIVSNTIYRYPTPPPSSVSSTPYTCSDT